MHYRCEKIDTLKVLVEIYVRNRYTNSIQNKTLNFILYCYTMVHLLLYNYEFLNLTTYKCRLTC